MSSVEYFLKDWKFSYAKDPQIESIYNPALNTYQIRLTDRSREPAIVIDRDISSDMVSLLPEILRGMDEEIRLRTMLRPSEFKTMIDTIDQVYGTQTSITVDYHYTCYSILIEGGKKCYLKEIPCTTSLQQAHDLVLEEVEKLL